MDFIQSIILHHHETPSCEASNTKEVARRILLPEANEATCVHLPWLKGTEDVETYSISTLWCRDHGAFSISMLSSTND